ncbi:DinB family protein [Paenibacillus caui]|uniref:DinB family protein n=1 Tax=Paenibacillus caui TaxID=2873927 RepID=UPI001CA90D22|nr:DinB family protein [Paenibacillus caui]
MNIYCSSALHQIQVAVHTTIEMMDKLKDDDLQKRPTPGKHSIRELLEHISIICKADALIADGASEESMSNFYAHISLKTLNEIKENLANNYQFLVSKYAQFTDEELEQDITSYWGVTYTRYEWLLEIVSHLYHHRGQLHAMLVHCCSLDPRVPLFE